MNKWFNRKAKVQEITIEEMTFTREAGLQLSITHPMLHRLACEMAKFFKDNGGVNFVSATMYHEDLGMFDFSIQRHDGKTPQQLVFELKEEIRRLKQIINN